MAVVIVRNCQCDVQAYLLSVPEMDIYEMDIYEMHV